MADPARTAKLTRIEMRQRGRDVCKAEPCLPVRRLIEGKPSYPPCVVCVHEAAVLKAMRGLEKG